MSRRPDFARREARRGIGRRFAQSRDIAGQLRDHLPQGADRLAQSQIASGVLVGTGRRDSAPCSARRRSLSAAAACAFATRGRRCLDEALAGPLELAVLFFEVGDDGRAFGQSRAELGVQPRDLAHSAKRVPPTVWPFRPRRDGFALGRLRGVAKLHLKAGGARLQSRDRGALVVGGGLQGQSLFSQRRDFGRSALEPRAEIVQARFGLLRVRPRDRECRALSLRFRRQIIDFASVSVGLRERRDWRPAGQDRRGGPRSHPASWRRAVRDGVVRAHVRRATDRARRRRPSSKGAPASAPGPADKRNARRAKAGKINRPASPATRRPARKNIAGSTNLPYPRLRQSRSIARRGVEAKSAAALSAPRSRDSAPVRKGSRSRAA